MLHLQELCIVTSTHFYLFSVYHVPAAVSVHPHTLISAVNLQREKRIFSFVVMTLVGDVCCILFIFQFLCVLYVFEI